MLQTLQQEFGSGAIVDVGGMHAVLQQVALRINEKMALAALDLLGAVIAARPSHLSGLDRLTVDDRRTRLRRPADRTAVALPQSLVHVLPGAILAPLGVVVEDSSPRRILVRQQPPLRSGAQQIEDGVDDAPQRIGLSPSGRMAAGDERLEQRPFGLIEIAGVRTDSHGTGSSNVKQPASASAAQHQTYSESMTYIEQ